MRKCSGEPLAAPLLSMNFVRLVLAAIRDIATKFPHAGSCPFLLQDHTGTLYSCMVRGCYRHPFPATSSSLSWLMHAEPTVLFQMVMSLSLGPLPPLLPHKVGSVAYLGVTVVHCVLHSSAGDFENLSPRQAAARRLRLRRSSAHLR